MSLANQAISVGAYLSGAAIRMLRTKWGSDVDLIAEELYTTLANCPDPQSGPVTINFGPNNTPQVTPPNFLLDPLGNFSLPDFSLPGFNFNNPNDVQQTDNPQNQDPSPNSPVPAKPKERTRSQIGYQRVTGPAQVISGGGQSYVCNFFPNGTSGDPKQVTVNQLQTGIDDLEAGDWLPVFSVIKYEMKVKELVENPGKANERVISTQTDINILSTTYDAIASKAAAGGGAVPGTVVGGSGDTYQMTIYPKGLGGETQQVTVKQLQIDPTETIPVGSWEMVSKVGSNYYVQFPVWLSNA